MVGGAEEGWRVGARGGGWGGGGRWVGLGVRVGVGMRGADGCGHEGSGQGWGWGEWSMGVTHWSKTILLVFCNAK